MSRSGPPGRTAAERNHPTRVRTQNPAEHGSAVPADGLLDAEAEAWIDAQHAQLVAEGRPVSKRHLRQRLVRSWRRELAAQDGTPALTRISRSGGITRSVPVDPMAERVAASLRRSA